MADNQITIRQIGEELEKALKPVIVRLDRFEKKQDDQTKMLVEHDGKIDSLMGEMLQMHQQVDVIEDRVERIEDKVDVIEDRVEGIEEKVGGLEEKVTSMDVTMKEMKVDLDVIKDDYIGQVDEIRSHVGMSAIIKHKTP